MKQILKTTFLFSISASIAFAANSTLLSDPRIGQLKQATLIAPTDPDKTIEFIVWLQLKNKKLFDDTLHGIFTPGSKMYHHFLTKKQFNATFFQTDENLNNIKNYLTSQGFTIVQTPKSHFYMVAKGTVTQIEHAFQMKINNYRYRGKIIYANSQAPSIRQDMVPLISQLTGFMPPFSAKCNSFTQTAGSYTPIYNLNGSLTGQLVNENGSVIDPQMKYSGFVPGGTNNSGYTPRQIQHAYGVDQLIARGINGTNQNIMVIEGCVSQTLADQPGSPIVRGDLNTFSSVNNLPLMTLGQNLIIYPGTPYSNCPCNSLALREETLDVEGAHAMAPNANIYVVWNSSGDSAALAQAVELAEPGYLISMSDSAPELNTDYADETPLQSAAMQNITVNVSSGDCGDNVAKTGTKQVNYPPSSNYATGVGGTALLLDTNDNYLAETGWGTALNVSYTCYPAGTNPCTAYQANYSTQGPNPLGYFEGSTGGLSQVFNAPVWQQNTISTLYAGGYGFVGQYNQCPQPGMCRAVPDISMFGDRFFPGFEIYMTQTAGSCPVPAPMPDTAAGTSLATPFFTGILALVNQERQSMGKLPIGLVSQYLYNLPANALNSVNNLHGIGNPVAGIPNPNIFQLFQVDPSTGNLNGVVFNLDSSLALGPIWSDIAGVGSPYAPVFVPALANK